MDSVKRERNCIASRPAPEFQDAVARGECLEGLSEARAADPLAYLVLAFDLIVGRCGDIVSPSQVFVRVAPKKPLVPLSGK